MRKYGYSEEKADIVKCKTESDFNSLTSNNIENLFDDFKNDKRNRTICFINYYNSIVLNHDNINFSTFIAQWKIRGMTKEAYSYFDDNFDILEKEIKDKKDIDSFFVDYCCENRKEAIFCCKLFHVILPSEFPLIDNYIIKHFKLNNEDKMTAYKIIKRGYDLYINKNEEKIKQIKLILSKEKYHYIRINELSNYRILDMIYWFKLARKPAIDRK